MSLLLNTRPGERMAPPDAAKLEVLRLDAIRRLGAEDLIPTQDELVTNLDRLVQQVTSSPTDQALALYAGKGVATAVTMGVPVEDRTVVDPTFATRDLVRALHRTPRHVVLVLSQRRAALLDGSAGRLTPVNGTRFPMSLDTLDGRPRDAARLAAVLRGVDLSLGVYLRLHPAPVVIVGPQTVVTTFRAHSRNLDRLAGCVYGGFDDAGLDETTRCTAARPGPVPCLPRAGSAEPPGATTGRAQDGRGHPRPSGSPRAAYTRRCSLSRRASAARPDCRRTATTSRSGPTTLRRSMSSTTSSTNSSRPYSPVADGSPWPTTGDSPTGAGWRSPFGEDRAARLLDDVLQVEAARVVGTTSRTGAAPDRLGCELLLLAGFLDPAVAALTASEPLGWSRPSHPGPVVLPYLWAAATATPRTGLLHTTFTAIDTLHDTHDYDRLFPSGTPEDDNPWTAGHESAPDRQRPTLTELLTETLTTRRATTPPTTDLIEIAHRITDVRIDAIVSNKHRGAYPRAAALAVAHAEALATRSPHEAAAYLSGIRTRYPRHVAFGHELDTAAKASSLHDRARAR